MKKFLAILTALLFVFAAVVVAAPAAKAAAKAPAAAPAEVKITTITKEASQAYYPSVLTPGSILGTYTFAADIPLLANVAVLDYVDDPMGSLIIKTDLGVVGISSLITPVTNLNDISVSLPDNVLGLWYGNTIAEIPMGVAVLYGSNKYVYNNQDYIANSVPYDHQDDFSQYLGVRLGAKVWGLDLGLNVSSELDASKLSDYDNSNGDWDYDQISNSSRLLTALSARMSLGNEMTTVATLGWLNGTSVNNYVDPGSDYVYKYTNSTLTLSALLEKIFKGDTLSVKMAFGLEVGGDANGRYEYIDNLYPWNNAFGSTKFQYGYLEIPLNVAVEGKLNDTWSINAGAAATILAFSNYWEKYNADPSNTHEKWADLYEYSNLDIGSSLNFAVGVTGKIGDLYLDMYLNPSLLLAGPNLISGASYGDMNYGVALYYPWN